MRVLTRHRVVPFGSSRCPPLAFLIFAIAFVLLAIPVGIQAGWSTPQTVVDGRYIEPLPSNNARCLAVDDSGKVHLVWSDRRDGDYDIYYLCFMGLGWSAETRVTSNSSPSKSPSIALDDAGTLHLVWLDNEDGTPQIYYKTYDGTSWSSQTKLTNSTGNPQGLSMAVDHADRVHVVWTDYTPGGWWLYYRCYDGESWGSIETLTPAGAWPYVPCVTTDAANDVHVVWRDDRVSDPEVYYRRRRGLAWEPEQKLTDCPGLAFGPSITVAGGGDIHVFWEDSRSGRWEIYHKVMSGGEWGPEEFFAGAGADLYGPSCCADREGCVYVVWYTPDPSQTQGAGVCFRKFDGVSWLPPDTLEYSGRDDMNPCVAVGGGRTDVVWQYGGVCWSCSAGSIPEPSLISLDTSAWPACETAPVRMTGLNLFYVERAWLARAGEDSIRVLGAGVSTTTLSAIFDIGPTTLGPWDVVVQSFSGGRDTLPATFTVEQGLWGADERLTQGGSSAELAGSTARAIAADSEGDLHVVWSDLRDGDREIYYKRCHAGSWGPDTRLTVASGASREPAIAVDRLDRLHVAWTDERDGNAEIYHKSYDGVSWGADYRVTSTSSPSNCPAIAADPSSNNVRIIWHEGASGDNSIYIRRFDGSTWFGAVRLYYGHTYGSTTPTIAADSGGNTHAAWVQYSSSTDFLLVYRKNNGSTWGSPVTLASAYDLGRPSICAGPGGVLHLAWHDRRFNDVQGAREIFYRRFNGLSWDSEQRLSEAKGHSQNPSVAVAADGVAHVVWSDSRWGDYEMYRRCFDGTRWTLGGRLTRSSGKSDPPSACCDATGNLHVIWQDDRDGHPEIYYNMAMAGSLAGVGGEAKHSDGPDRQVEAIAASPNPARSGATLRFSTAREGPVRLALYDITGRRVWSHDAGRKSPGHYEVFWNGRDDKGRVVSAGVYFCRLQTGHGPATAKLIVLR